MIKKIVFSGLFLISIFAYSQNGKVGIGTKSPQQVLHIDAAKNTPAGSTTSNVADDVVVTQQGYLGIGTVNPTKRLEIQSTTSKNGAVKIVDGTQQNNAFLQTDGNGLAQWYVQGSIKSIVLGRFEGVATNSTNGATYRDIKASITLTPGIWMVNFGGTFKISNDVKTPYWIHAWLSDTQGQKIDTDPEKTNITFLGPAGSGTGYAGLMIPGQIGKSGNANLLTGSTIIKVGNKIPTTTIWVTLENVHTSNPNQNWQFFGGNWENYFFAVPLDGN